MNVRAMIIGLASLALTVGCSTYKDSGGNGNGGGQGAVHEGDHPSSTLEARAQHTIDMFQKADPSMDRFFENAAGYAVFPEITKGAVGIGGAAGDGVVYDKTGVIGHARLAQGTIGAQLGGQKYSEVIFFETQVDLDRFKRDELEFAAQASAVAAAKDSGANADYSEGVAIFTMGREGLMFEASVGGQKFRYEPK